MKKSEIKQIAIVGAGLTGHGIALEFALAGYQVNLNSRSEDSLSRARDRIDESLAMLQRLGKVSSHMAKAAPHNVHTNSILSESVKEADLVIEAVYEDIELKRSIFHQLDELCPEHTILASNTSTLSPTVLSSATQRPDKVLVAHYVNPTFLVPFVEIVRTEYTSDETVAAVHDLLSKIGKDPIVLQKDVPGFLSQRLQMALAREALGIVQNGIATAQDVDRVIKTSLGRRWAVAGVFEIFELAGLDLMSAIASELWPHLETTDEILPVLREKVEKQELGVKSGKGFYDWTPESAALLRQRIAHALVEIDKWPQ